MNPTMNRQRTIKIHHHHTSLEYMQFFEPLSSKVRKKKLVFSTIKCARRKFQTGFQSRYIHHIGEDERETVIIKHQNTFGDIYMNNCYVCNSKAWRHMHAAWHFRFIDCFAMLIFSWHYRYQTLFHSFILKKDNKHNKTTMFIWKSQESL